MIYLLPHLIESAAEREPDAVAVSCRGETITYADLVNRSRALARLLRELGVSPGDRVGIYLNKGIDSAIALYGAMFAGAAYVPLDPLSPTSRLAFVIRDCGIRVLISESRKETRLAKLDASGLDLRALVGFESENLGYETHDWPLPEPGDLAIDPAVTTQDLCYILYTSGSTGVPKGIMHTHSSALAWAEVTTATYGMGPSDAISNYAPLHFDLSTLDFFGGARAGSKVVMIPEEHMKMPVSLASLIEQERLTQFYTVPLALIQLVGEGVLEGRDLSSLRRVLFGGEPMPIKHLRRLMDLLPDASFYNVYGPTETNGCTHFEVPADLSIEDEALPIGRPYPNVETMIVDGQDREVEPGQSGELLVRAPTMMSGYWGRPDLNEGAFFYRRRHAGLPDVFERTGDLAHVDAEGLIHFHGRKDRQIKTRGYRVELDEVEAVLVSQPGVAEGAVFAAGDADGSMSIMAAVILAEDAGLGFDSIVAFMGERLPPYALPTFIDIRDDFPRTTTGKIDRRRLAESSVTNQDGG